MFGHLVNPIKSESSTYRLLLQSLEENGTGRRVGAASQRHVPLVQQPHHELIESVPGRRVLQQTNSSSENPVARFRPFNPGIEPYRSDRHPLAQRLVLRQVHLTATQQRENVLEKKRATVATLP